MCILLLRQWIIELFTRPSYIFINVSETERGISILIVLHILCAFIMWESFAIVSRKFQQNRLQNYNGNIITNNISTNN